MGKHPCLNRQSSNIHKLPIAIFQPTWLELRHAIIVGLLHVLFSLGCERERGRDGSVEKADGRIILADPAPSSGLLEEHDKEGSFPAGRSCLPGSPNCLPHTQDELLEELEELMDAFPPSRGSSADASVVRRR
jgi:hypothetical protein